MPYIVGIRFKRCGKIYNFEVDDIDTKQGDLVVVESDFGISIGRVVVGRHFVDSMPMELKKVLRLVNEEDLRAVEENKEIEKEAHNFCIERVKARGLQMKLVAVETTLDRKRIIFYFTADGRIDFRELVKDLAARFKTRIEMRQIGVRDEAKLIGGIGVCGRELCCDTFLSSFEPVSIKMAKKQDISLNVGKISGLCGRLMCCLRYEYEGNMEEISSDDEILIEDDDTVSEKTEIGISSVLSKLEQVDVEEEPVETTAQTELAEVEKGDQSRNKLSGSEQTEYRHKKFRHKRRHFRK